MIRESEKGNRCTWGRGERRNGQIKRRRGERRDGRGMKRRGTDRGRERGRQTHEGWVGSEGCLTHDGRFFASLILTIRTVFW